MSSSEVAYRAVLAVQDHKARAESNSWGPDVSNKQSTPMTVWGAMFGMMAGAFSGAQHGFFHALITMLVGMALGVAFVWAIGKVLALFCWTLGLVFRTVRKLVKGTAKP